MMQSIAAVSALSLVLAAAAIPVAAQQAKSAKKQPAASAQQRTPVKRPQTAERDCRWYNCDPASGLRDMSAPLFPLRSSQDTQAFWDSFRPSTF